MSISLAHDAASTVIVRSADPSGQDSVEVLLVKRRITLEFLGGALVFPGGRVDDMDRAISNDLWTGPPLHKWTSRLHLEDQTEALGFLAAAVREVFEEAGLLLAHGRDGRRVTAQYLRRESVREVRDRLNDRGGSWDWQEWLRAEGLQLAFGRMTYLSCWVTPEMFQKRFNTRFFLTRLPEGQVASPDGGETVSADWWRPRNAIAAGNSGTEIIVHPTISNLKKLE